MRRGKLVFSGLVVLITGALVFIGLQILLPKAKPILEPTAKITESADTKEKIHYVAIGDSLTEGIGDDAKRGGFVPIVAGDLQEHYQLTSVEVENYGVAGERSDQILKRMKKQEKIQKNLKTADVITVTVGGNDLMKVIQDNLFGLSVKSFDKPRAKYQERITEMIMEIRELNKTAPVYVLGIYNPFYLNFPEITDMQTIVDRWNEGTQEVVEANEFCHFIPINDLLYQGLNEEVGIASEVTSSEEAEIVPSDSSDLNTVDNNVLYDGDKFHPNNIGYQLMANAVRDEMIKTQKEWLPKGAKE